MHAWLEEKLDEYDRAISEIARENERSKRLMQLRGIGPTTASALAASIGAGHDFGNGRQVAAWLGLTPGLRYSRWVRDLIERRGYWRAAIAIAAKNARMAMLNRDMAKVEASARTLIETAARHGLQFWKTFGDLFEFWTIARTEPTRRRPDGRAARNARAYMLRFSLHTDADRSG